MAYEAPYQLSTEIVPIPTEGTFLLPVCTTAERLAKILSALYYGGLNIFEPGEMTHLVDVLDAMSRIRPECDLEPTGCTTFESAQDRITYFPALDATSLPLGYLTNPWVTLTGDNPVVGLKTGDIITDVLHIPLLPSIWDHLDEPSYILQLGYPSISIENLQGAGTVRVYLLNILLGGRAILVRDNNLFTMAILDTNLNTTSLPPETYTENLIEYEFEGTGTHRLDIVFVPNVNADIQFLGFGGGIRKVEICGFEENDMPENCCDETNDLLKKMLKIMENGFKIVPIEGIFSPPDVGGGDCAPSFFDHDEDEVDTDVLLQREKALCLTAQRYVKGILIAALVDMGAPGPLISWIEDQIPTTLPPQFVKLQVVYPAILEGLSAFYAALSGGLVLDIIACQMVAALEGETRNTFFNFKNSVNSNSFETLLAPLSALIESSNGLKINYTLFNQALEFANDEDLSDYTCPCVPEVAPGYCDEPLSLFASDSWASNTGTTITMVEPDIYHIVQLTAVSGVYYAGIEETSGRCLRFELATGYTHQAATVFNAKGCCDDADISAQSGDFVGGLFKAVQWAVGTGNPIDAYLKITCEDCCPELELEDHAGTGCVYQYMGDCIWKFTNSSFVQVGDQQRYYYSFRSITGECLSVANSDVAAYPTQGVGNDTTIVDCDDVESNFTGGFTPGDLKSAKWYGAQPQYFKIKPA